MQILFILFFIIISIDATEYRKVFEQNIFLDKSSKATLKLYEEDVDD